MDRRFSKVDPGGAMTNNCPFGFRILVTEHNNTMLNFEISFTIMKHTSMDDDSSITENKYLKT